MKTMEAHKSIQSFKGEIKTFVKKGVIKIELQNRQLFSSNFEQKYDRYMKSRPLYFYIFTSFNA